MTLSNRAQTLEKHEFPPDWSEDERLRWLEVWKQVRAAKADMKRVVFVSGVFDLMHEEHVNFLQRARQVGNFLIVAIESDKRVREMKGPPRPIDNEAKRVANVLNTEVVDVAEILPEAFSRPEHHRALISLLRPHILAVSASSPYQTEKRKIIEEFGGKLQVVLEHNPAVSTTNKLKALQ